MKLPRDPALEKHFANMSRRHFLRGLGACIALPAMHSLIPARMLALYQQSRRAGKVSASATGVCSARS